MADAAFDHVHTVVGDDVVRTAASGTWNVNLIVLWIQWSVFVGFIEVDVVRSQIFEFTFPQNSSGVDVSGTQTVHSFDEQSASNDLLRRAVSVTW